MKVLCDADNNGTKYRWSKDKTNQSEIKEKHMQQYKQK